MNMRYWFVVYHWDGYQAIFDPNQSHASTSFGFVNGERLDFWGDSPSEKVAPGWYWTGIYQSENGGPWTLVPNVQSGWGER